MTTLENEPDDFYVRLIDTVSGKVNHRSISTSRRALMALVAEGYGDSCIGVLLWLNDKVNDRPELFLSIIYDDVPQGGETPQVDFRNISISWDGHTSPPLLSEINERVLRRYENFNGGRNLMSRVLELAYTEKEEGGDEITHRLGFIQLMLTPSAPYASSFLHKLKRGEAFHKQSGQPEAKSKLTQNLPTSCNAAVKALSARIFTDRDVRQMKISHSLHKNLWDENDLQQVLEKTASILTSSTRAQMCLIYRPTREATGKILRIDAADKNTTENLSKKKLDALAPTSDTLTAYMFEHECIVRINDIGDPAGVKKSLPDFEGQVDQTLLANFDAILSPKKRVAAATRSRMYAPVRVPIVGGGETSVALIKVLSKDSTIYLQDRFSLADEEMLHSTCRYLVSVLPGIEMMDAMKSISAALAKVRIVDTDKQPLNVIAQILLDNLKKWVKGIEAVSFVFDRLNQGATCPDSNDWPDDLHECEPQLNQIVQIGSKRRWCYATNPSGSAEGHGGRMLVGLSTDKLPAYQAEIIDRAATSVWLAAYEVAAYNQATKYLIETRHAIRSGVQGLIGHISVAINQYRLVAEYDTPEFSHDNLIRQAAFRKRLEKGFLAAHQTHILLESARLIHTGVQYASLKIAEHNLPTLLSEVRSIVLPEAESRRLEIHFNNKIKEELERGSFDREAIFIVLFNLLDNAIKYAARDSTIVINAWVAQRCWHVSIEDEGVYVAPEDYETIFQSYTRIYKHDAAAHDGISSRPGTGLGLSISRMIVRAHSPQAKLEVESVLLEPKSKRARTTFTIKMPRQLSKETT